MQNDLRVLRQRHEDLAVDGDLALAGGAELGSAAFLGQTVQVTTYPTAAGVFYGIAPVDISGTETEGAAATYVRVGTAVRYALNLGTQVPPVGTTVVCHAAGGRWVFRYDG